MSRTHLQTIGVALFLGLSYLHDPLGWAAETALTQPPRPQPQATPVEQGKIHVGFLSISVKATAPIPSEIENETQAHAMSRDAAILTAQNILLTYVLEQRGRSGRKLSVSEIPSTEMQQRIRGFVKGAKVMKTVWKDKTCIVTLTVNKRDLRLIRRKG